MSRLHEALTRVGKATGPVPDPPAWRVEDPAVPDVSVADAVARDEEPRPHAFAGGGDGFEIRAPFAARAAVSTAEDPAFVPVRELFGSGAAARDEAPREQLSVPDDFTLQGPFATRAIIHPEADPAFVDEFRKLAATLHHAQMQHNVLRTVSISSAAPKEGKTLTAINLALTLRVSYQRRVLLIDADLRAPSIHRLLALPVAPGLADMVDGPTFERWPVTEVVPGLFVLPAGTPTRDPTSRLSSDRMRQLLAEARERYDWVIIDLSPLGPSADAQLVTALSDGTLVIVDTGRVPARVIQRAVDAIGEEKVIGVVMNRMPPAALGDAYGAYPADYAAAARVPR